MCKCFQILIFLLLSPLLSGCNTIYQWDSDRKLRALKSGADYCGKQYLNKYISTQFDDIVVRDHLPSKYEFRVADPRSSEDEIFITDLRISRMSIYLDKNGTILRLECG